MSTTRKKRLILTFRHPFSLKGVDREELIEGLSLPVYRRVAPLMFLPVDARRSTSEIVPVDPVDLAEAHARDSATRADL